MKLHKGRDWAGDYITPYPRLAKAADLVVGAIVVFLVCLALFSCDDGERNHEPTTCVRVLYSACLPTGSNGRARWIACALIGEGNVRADVYFSYPIIEGDEVCTSWKDIRP